MALFKSNIVDQYNIMNYEGDALLLHCSRDELIKAPCSGKLGKNGVITYGNKKIVFTHMNLIPESVGKVNEGDVIGIPLIENNKAYIGLAIYNNGKKENVITYLHRKDIDNKPKKKNNKEIDA